MRKTPHVVLIIETCKAYGRGVLKLALERFPFACTFGSEPSPRPSPGVPGEGEELNGAYRWLQCVLGMVLLLAAEMKGWELIGGMRSGRGFLDSRYVAAAQVGCEGVLGLWLVVGGWPRVLWAVSTGCFAAFVAVSGWKGIRGDASCGCFGAMAIHPWYMVVLDGVAVVLLVMLRKGRTRPVGPPRNGQPSQGVYGIVFRLGVAMALAGVLGGMWGYWNRTGKSEGIVYLRPEEWVGKRLPLLGQINIGSQLGEGRWVVVIYSSYCGHCRPVVPEYEQLAIELADRVGGPRIALVEVPPCAPPGKNPATGLTPAVVGHLEEGQKWFVVTPVIVGMEEGKVLGLAGEDEGKRWVERVFWGKD